MTAAKKKAKAECQKKYDWVFMNGKQVRIKRPEMIEGMLVDDWIEQNAIDGIAAKRPITDSIVRIAVRTDAFFIILK